MAPQVLDEPVRKASITEDFEADVAGVLPSGTAATALAPPASIGDRVSADAEFVEVVNQSAFERRLGDHRDEFAGDLVHGFFSLPHVCSQAAIAW